MTCRVLKCPNQVSPEIASVTHDDKLPTHSWKRNGWSCPWHPFQLFAWVILLGFCVSYFGVMVSYLPSEWEASGYIIPGSLFVIHMFFHLVCLTVDPADTAVRKSQLGKMPFDRQQRAHVIENCHCYICQAYVNNSSKHCSVCNKCISEFDHHCKWLNNCIGGRNYKLFLGCIVSAFLGAFALFTITLFQFVMYFHKSDTLLSYNGSSHWVIFVTTSAQAYVAFLSVHGLLLLLAMGLLAHLILFHMYLIKQNMTTYDYILRMREKMVAADPAESSSQAKVSAVAASLASISHEAASFRRDGVAIVAVETQEGLLLDQQHCAGRPHSTDASQQQQQQQQQQRADRQQQQQLLYYHGNKDDEANHNVIPLRHPPADSDDGTDSQLAAGSDEEISAAESDESSLVEAADDNAALVRMDLFAATVRARSESPPLDRPLPPLVLSNDASRKERTLADLNFGQEQRASFKQSESRTELLTRENSKKRSMKKKKKPRAMRRPLPPPLPIVGTGRPLPKLPTLDEERDHVSEC